MNGTFTTFLSLPEQDRRDVFAAAAVRLDTLPSYVEKDFWVCLVLDLLFNGLADRHPKLLFKGGTSLSKAFGLIQRLSEDVDLVVNRGDLGFANERDPTAPGNLSNKQRQSLFKDLMRVCSGYVLGDLKATLGKLIGDIADGCRVVPDEEDADGQTLLVQYRTLYPSVGVTYVNPRVRIEAGARSGLEPSLNRNVVPYVADDLPDWSLNVAGVEAISPERTYWEKLLILHGLHCGYRDTQRLPRDRDRISRHYYDAAMITATETGQSALSNIDLLHAVRDHNLIAFRQAWKRFDQAVPGSVRLVPQPELRAVIERDYRAMQGMILGDLPEFEWVMDLLQRAQATIQLSS